MGRHSFLLNMKFILSIAWLALATAVWGQREPFHGRDSLERIAHGAAADTIRIQAYIALTEKAADNSPDAAFPYCRRALDLSLRAHYPPGLENAYGWMAYLSEQKGRIRQALDYYGKALGISRQIGDRKNESTVLNNIAAIYKDQGEVIRALEIDQQCLRIKREIGDKAGMSSTYNNIGLIFAGQGKIDQALDYYSKALKIEEDLRDQEGIATGLQNIAAVYKDQREYDKAREYLLRALRINRHSGRRYDTGYTLNSLGLLYGQMGDGDTAVRYLDDALAVRRDIGDTQGIAYTLKNIGNVYRKRGFLADAEKAFGESLRNFEKVGDKSGLAAISNLLGETAELRNDPKQAEAFYERSLALSKELGYPANISDAAKNLQQLYRKQSRWKQALDMNDMYITMRDSVENDKTRRAAIRTQFEYDYQEKARARKLAHERLVAEEERRQNIQYALIAAGILSLIVLFLLVSQTVVVNTKMIRFFGVITLLVVFEFLNMLLHPMLEHATRHDTILMLLALVCIASLLVPMHHRIEHWAVNALVEKNKRIRQRRIKPKPEKTEEPLTEITDGV